MAKVWLDETSFNNLSKWIEDVRSERGSDAIVVVVGNKIDMEEKRLFLSYRFRVIIM